MVHAPRSMPQRTWSWLTATKLRVFFLFVATLALVGYAARDAILVRVLRHQLQALPGAEVSLLKAHVHPLLNGVTISGVQVVRPADKGRKGPAGRTLRLAEVNHVEVRWPWRGLLRGGLVCEIDVDGVDASLWRIDGDELATPLGAKKVDKDEVSPPPAQTIVAAWPQIAHFVVPLAIDEVTVRRARFWLRDCTTDPQVKLAVDSLDLHARNLTDRDRLAGGNYATVDVAARPVGGRFTAHLELDPMAKVPTFGLRTNLSDVQLYKLNALLQAYAGFDVEIGMFNAQVEVKSEKGRFRGFVEPRITGLRIKNRADEQHDSVLNRLWRQSVKAVSTLVENSKAEQIATRLPISGQFIRPEIGVWDAVTTLLANAYLQALSPTGAKGNAEAPILPPKTQTRGPGGK